MNKEYFIRRLTEKGKLKTPLFPNGEPMASWRTFESEKDALAFAKEYELDNIVILAKYLQPRENAVQRFD